MVRRVWRGPLGLDMWRGRDHARRQLVNLPLVYFEIEDVRPDESQG
jgi:hypothetical protein